MSTGIQFTPIRQAVLDGISGLGVPAPAISRTAFLIRDGYCVGQRFFCDGIQAVWLMAEWHCRIDSSMVPHMVIF